MLALQSDAKDLGQSSTFQSQTATSSNPSALAATVTGNPAAGTYEYTPIQTAQSEQLLSSGFQSETAALGGGTLTYRYGNTVNQGVSLSDINGGQGFTPGEIRITDRSGASAVVNLSSAQNVNDVLNAINNSGLDVTATTVDGQIELTDNTSAGTSRTNLQVKDVGNGATAESLGLSGIDTSNATATGTSIYTLGNNLSLSTLNDGMGIRIAPAVADITYTLHDGTTGTIDLVPVASGSSTPDEPTTLGNVIQEISQQTGGKLQVSVAADGRSLEVTDTTAAGNPGGTLTIGNATGSTAASDLGIAVNAASSGTVTGSDVLGGLQTVLLSSLNGGQGLGSLGYMKLTDRNGNSVNVNLSGATTLQDVINDINSQIQTANAQPGATAVGITAQVNQAGDGIELVDTTGSAIGTLTAANSDAADDGGNDGTNTAVNSALPQPPAPAPAATGVLNSGDMHLRTISTNTLLDSLNGDEGVADGSFTVTNSAGVASTVNITSLDADGRRRHQCHQPQRQGRSGRSQFHGRRHPADRHGRRQRQALRHRRQLDHRVRPRSSHAAATQVGGAWTIDGSTTHTITLAAGDSLNDLVNDINEAGNGLSASILNDGSNSPYRLSLTGTQTGAAAGLVVDASQISGMSMQQLTSAQNALGWASAAACTPRRRPGRRLVHEYFHQRPVRRLAADRQRHRPARHRERGLQRQPIGHDLAVVRNDYNSFITQLNTATAYDATTNTGAVLSAIPPREKPATSFRSSISRHV